MNNMKKIIIVLGFTLISFLVFYAKIVYKQDPYLCINNKKMFQVGEKFVPMKDELNIDVPCKNE